MSKIKEKPIRSILKSLSWRVTATLTTITISFFLTGEITTALQIGGLEFILKMLIYYLHERLWSKAKIGLEEANDPEYHI